MHHSHTDYLGKNVTYVLVRFAESLKIYLLETKEQLLLQLLTPIVLEGGIGRVLELE